MENMKWNFMITQMLVFNKILMIANLSQDMLLL